MSGHETGNDGGASSDPGRLVRLADFDPQQPARILADLRDYWQSLRKGRAIPARSDVEPRGICRALDYAFVLERIAPGAARFRLAGRHLVDLMGMEVRGMPFCALLAPGSRGRLSDVLETVFKAPQIAELRLTAQQEYSRPELSARALLLPLKSDLGDVTRALGCLIAEGTIGVAPRRFDLVDEIITPVFEGAVIMPPSPSAIPTLEQAGFREPDQNWRPQRKVKLEPTPPSPPTPIGDTATPEERRARFRIISSGQVIAPKGERF